jgi:hypothetical protein
MANASPSTQQSEQHPRRYQPVCSDAGFVTQNYSRARESFDVGYLLGTCGHDLSRTDHHADTYSNDYQQLLAGWNLAQSWVKRHGIEKCRYQRKVTQLRFSAWRRNRAFDAVNITAAYLKKIDTAFCPITRSRMTHGLGDDTDWSVERVKNDLGYSFGNLAIISVRANRAKGSMNLLDIVSAARRSISGEARMRPGALSPLSEAELCRLIYLCLLKQDEYLDREIMRVPLGLRVPILLACNPSSIFKFKIFDAVCDQVGVKRYLPLLRDKKAKKALQRYAEDLEFCAYGVRRNMPSCVDDDAPWNTWAYEDASVTPLLRQRWQQFCDHLSVDDAHSIIDATDSKMLRIASDDMDKLQQLGGADNKGYARGAAQSQSAQASMPEGHSAKA